MGVCGGGGVCVYAELTLEFAQQFVLQLLERVVARLVLRDDVLFVPRPARELVEVVARVNFRVDRLQQLCG